VRAAREHLITVAFTQMVQTAQNWAWADFEPRKEKRYVISTLSCRWVYRVDDSLLRKKCFVSGVRAALYVK